MNWKSGFAAACLVVALAASIGEAQIGTTSVKLKGDFIWGHPDSAAANDSVMIRFPAGNAESDSMPAVSTGSGSVPFAQFIVDQSCSLRVYSRSTPGGSTAIPLLVGAVLPASVWFPGVDKGVDSVYVFNNSASVLHISVVAFR